MHEPRMTNIRKSITGRGDILEIERQPYDLAVPLRNTHDIFLRAAKLFGARPAITHLQSGEVGTRARVISYVELLANIQRAANLFRSLGVGPDDAVVMLLPSMPEAHFALWGAQLAGRACPINFMLGVDHIAELIDAAGAKVVVALAPDPDFEIWDKAEKLRARFPGVRLLRVGDPIQTARPDAFEALLAQQFAELQFARSLTPETIAAYYHTGGTTGAPKLAQHTHGNEVHTSWFAGMYYGLGETDTMINGFPLFHVAGAFVYGASCFCAGTNIVVPPRLGMRHRQFVTNYWHFVEHYAVNYLATVPTVIATLLDTPTGAAELSSIKALYTGGSPLPTELANAFEKRFNIPVRNILGMTESAGLVSIEPLAAPRNPLSCGLPLPFTEVFAVPLTASGPDLSKRCEPNQPGVIVLRGPHVGPGYTNSANDAGMYARGGYLISGDLGHVDEEGRVYITGRTKDVIIRGAHNIDPSMIEEAFARHPDVQTCAAVGEPDPYAGELPVVFLTLRPGATATKDEIMEHVTPFIAERAAVPKRVTILETLPTTAIGKIYKPTLRQRAIEHAYTDALHELGSLVEKIQVKGIEVPGGLAAEIRVWPRSDRAAIEAGVAKALKQFTVPYQLRWQ
jgi:fatty-acyl-CoA synthase